jgi:AraC family transcriptional regulator
MQGRAAVPHNPSRNAANAKSRLIHETDMKSDARLEHEQRITELLNRVCQNLDEEWTATQLADEAGFSRFHFTRVFTGLLGESPGDLHRRLRLERAAAQLAETEKSIGEIALDAGYAPEAFTRIFREFYHTSPSEFRKRPAHPWLQAANRVHFNRVTDLVFRGDQPMKLEIRELEHTPILALRHVGPYHEIGEAFRSLFAQVEQNAVPVIGPGFALYHDDPGQVPQHELRSDAAVPVPPDFDSAPAGLHLAAIPAGRYAVGVHKGPYEQLGDAWDRFHGQDMVEAGVEARESVCFERYLNDWTIVPPEELLTEIWVPIA